MNQRCYHGKSTFPANIKPIFEEKLSYSKYKDISDQEELSDDKLIKLIAYLSPSLSGSRKAVLENVSIGCISLREAGEKAGLTSERARQLLNLIVSEMIFDINAVFFLLPYEKAKEYVQRVKQNYITTEISVDRRTFIEKDANWFNQNEIYTLCQLYERLDEMKARAENITQKKRLDMFAKEYEENLARFDFWDDF